MILIANEFFDAIAIRQLERRGGRWHERVIGLDQEGNLGLGLAPTRSTTASSPPGPGPPRRGPSPRFRRPAGSWPRRLAPASRRRRRSPSSSIMAICHRPRATRSRRLPAIAGPNFWTPGRGRHHRPCRFCRPCRLTAQGRCNGLPRHGSGSFLAAMGLAARVAALQRGRDATAQAETAAAAARLAAADQMGNLFKVLGAGHPDLPPPYPFPRGAMIEAAGLTQSPVCATVSSPGRVAIRTVSTPRSIAASAPVTTATPSATTAGSWRMRSGPSRQAAVGSPDPQHHRRSRHRVVGRGCPAERRCHRHPPPRDRRRHPHRRLRSGALRRHHGRSSCAAHAGWKGASPGARTRPWTRWSGLASSPPHRCRGRTDDRPGSL